MELGYRFCCCAVVANSIINVVFASVELHASPGREHHLVAAEVVRCAACGNAGHGHVSVARHVPVLWLCSCAAGCGKVQARRDQEDVLYTTQEETSQDEMSLKQAQDSGLAPLASGEYGTRKTIDGAQDEGEDGIAQMVGFASL